MRKHDVSAVILAAGISTRLGGRLKALRDLSGKSFLARVVEAFKQGGVDDIIVVTGHEAEECAALAERLGARPAYNAGFASGMFSSIQTGFKAALREFPDRRAVMLSPVDAALLMPRSVTVMLETWRGQEAEARAKRIIIAAMNGRCGHPALIPAAHLPAILERPDSGSPLPEEPPDTPWGLRGYYHELTRRGNASLFELPLPDIGVLSDLDNEADSAAAEDFLTLTENRTLPSVEEAWQLLKLSDLKPKKIRHCILVARGSLRLGLKMAEKAKAGHPLLHMTSGLLHDLMRLESEHAFVAAEFLRRLGWPKTAFIVGCHTRLPDEYLARLGISTEDKKFKTAEIPPEALSDPALGDELFYGALAVYMADKYARREHLSGISERFADIRNWFSRNPEAITGLDERERVVKELEARISAWLGCDLLKLVSTHSGHPLETALDEAVGGEC